MVVLDGVLDGCGHSAVIVSAAPFSEGVSQMPQNTEEDAGDLDLLEFMCLCGVRSSIWPIRGPGWL